MIHVIVDTETTGLDPRKSFIISNGALLYDDINHKTDEFYELLNWKLVYPEFTTAPTENIHKISDSELSMDGIFPTKSFAHFYDFINSFGPLNTIVAFNTAYDHNMYISNLLNIINCGWGEEDDIKKCEKLLQMMTKNYDENNVNKIIFFDCMLYDRIFHFEVNFEKVKHNLEDVGLRYNIDKDPNAHNALADVRRTFEVYKCQLKELDKAEIDLDERLESRFVKQYERNRKKWASNSKGNRPENNIDYLGFKMDQAKF